MPWDFDISKVVNSAPIAAGLGSLVALRFVPGSTFKEKVCVATSSALVSIYGSTALAHWFGITDDKGIAAMAFGIAMLGLSIADAIVRAIKELKLSAIASGWLQRPGAPKAPTTRPPRGTKK